MFIKIINNTPETYPYNPQVDHPLTSFPQGASYPDFDCYWVFPTAPNNPDPELFNAVEGSPVFNGVLNRWEQSWEFVEKPEELPVPNWDGFYDALIVSDVYNYLLMQTIPYPSISGVMAVMGFAIKDGQADPGNPNRLAALQAAVSAVLGALNAIQQPLTNEQLAKVRGLLDSNGFGGITL